MMRSDVRSDAKLKKKIKQSFFCNKTTTHNGSLQIGSIISSRSFFGVTAQRDVHSEMSFEHIEFKLTDKRQLFTQCVSRIFGQA